MSNGIFPAGSDMASAEAYATRQMQRYDRRLLKVRAEQDYHRQMLELAERPPRSPWIGIPKFYCDRLEQLAKRIIRRRDAHMMQFIAVLSPETYR